jgi:cob(I)alamin adenosyltransferase
MKDAMSEDDLNVRHAEKMRKKKAARDKILATKTIEKGLLIVHTGKGKGKSTAAFGMVFRALGHGFRVGVVQFVKGIWQTGERVVLDKFPDQVTIKAMGEGFTWETQDRVRDIAAARQAWEQAKEMIADPSYRMVLLDELNIVLRYDYLPLDEVVEVLKPPAARHPRHRHRAQRQGRDHRDRRPGHRDGVRQAPLPLRRQGAGRDRVLMRIQTLERDVIWLRHLPRGHPHPALPPEGGGSRKALHRSPPPQGEGLGVGCWREWRPQLIMLYGPPFRGGASAKTHRAPGQFETPSPFGVLGSSPSKSTGGAPAMILRYSRPEMAAIWSPETKFRIWFEIEAHAAQAMADLGVIPAEAARTIWDKGASAVFDIARIDEIEREVKHDVIAFLSHLAEIVGPEARFVHQGMTSSDVLDTCLACS